VSPTMTSDEPPAPTNRTSHEQPADAEHGNRSEEGARGAHYFAVYGRERAAETLVRTAVSARFMVRMGSPVRFRRGAPHRG
jgi:hypothetical protein